MKKIIFFLTFIFAFTAFAGEEEDKEKDVITVKCSGVLEKYTAKRAIELKTDHTIQLKVEKEDDKDPGYINKNGIMTFSEGYEVVYNIHVSLGKGGIFSANVDTTAEIRARLQRHTGGNGKVVLGASALTIKQKAQKNKSKIGIGIVNVRALDTVVKENDFTIENDPILFQKDLTEAVYTGTLDEGVVKSAQIECSTL